MAGGVGHGTRDHRGIEIVAPAHGRSAVERRGHAQRAQIGQLIRRNARDVNRDAVNRVHSRWIVHRAADGGALARGACRIGRARIVRSSTALDGNPIAELIRILALVDASAEYDLVLPRVARTDSREFAGRRTTAGRREKHRHRCRHTSSDDRREAAAPRRVCRGPSARLHGSTTLHRILSHHQRCLSCQFVSAWRTHPQRAVPPPGAFQWRAKALPGACDHPSEAATTDTTIMRLGHRGASHEKGFWTPQRVSHMTSDRHYVRDAQPPNAPHPRTGSLVRASAETDAAGAVDEGRDRRRSRAVFVIALDGVSKTLDGKRVLHPTRLLSVQAKHSHWSVPAVAGNRRFCEPALRAARPRCRSRSGRRDDCDAEDGPGRASPHRLRRSSGRPISPPHGGRQRRALGDLR